MLFKHSIQQKGGLGQHSLSGPGWPDLGEEGPGRHSRSPPVGLPPGPCYTPATAGPEHEGSRLVRFGIHVPRQRTLTATAEYARDAGCDTIQIFSGNPVGWTIGRLDPADRDGFVAIVRDAGMEPVVVHAPYLINLASPDAEKLRLSRKALVDAMDRAHALSAGPVVVHAGNHKGRGTEAGIASAAESIARVLERSPAGVRLAIENGVGKGTEIGTTMNELGQMVSPFPADRVGVLLDTAHLWGAGYDMRRREELDRLLLDIDRGPGLDRVWCFHLNDSLAELGSGHDRHSLWTEGEMGATGLRTIVSDGRLAHLPMIFEVPGDTLDFDRKRLASMRRRDRRYHGAVGRQRRTVAGTERPPS